VRRHGRERTRTALGALALGAVAWQAARLAGAFARDVADYRRSAVLLRRVWTAVAVPGASRPLRLHARLATYAGAMDPPVVLVHGYGVSSRYFVPLAARLAPTLHVYAPDLPGHGDSASADAPLSVPQLAAALDAWMEAWALRGAVLVGQSMGAQIATELAARAPDRVAGLVLVAPTIDPDARSARRQIARAARTAFAERPLLDLWAALDYVRAGPRLIVREMRHMLAHRLEELLPVLDLPTRVICGAHDRITPQTWAEGVAARLGGAPVVTVPDAAHAVQYDAPDAVAVVVRELVADVVARTRRSSRAHGSAGPS
jgi:pimeloyl-ACP methyl ester carboxylesterase